MKVLLWCTSLDMRGLWRIWVYLGLFCQLILRRLLIWTLVKAIDVYHLLILSSPSVEIIFTL
jgi:hypothetical protein